MPRFDLVAGSAFIVHNAPTPNPSAFAEVIRLPSVQSTLRIANISTLVYETNEWNLQGFRQYWHVVTIKANATLFDRIFDIFLEEVEALKNVKDILPSYVLQPMKHIMSVSSHKNGGNSVGMVEDADGPLVMLSASPIWSKKEDDELVIGAFNRFFTRAEELAKEMGAWHPFLYQNYADGSQDVFRGYKEGNREKLRAIKKAYDPAGVLERLQPGYFNV